jgi:integrase
MKTRISKAYRRNEHVGWKKTVGGREWFLGYGTSPADEAKSIQLAEVLEATWRLAKAAGATELSQTDFEAAKSLLSIRPRRLPDSETTPAIIAAIAAVGAEPTTVCPPQPALMAPPAPAPVSAPNVGRWLYAAIDEFVSTTKRSLKADLSNSDHVCNTCERILRARDGIQDLPLESLRRKELDDWLLTIRNLPSKLNGQPLSPPTIRNMASAVRAALTKFAEWEWWTPPILWEKAFKNYSIKKLQSPTERKRRRMRPPTHSVDEKRVLWHLGLPFDRAMMALADWAGHTQTEIATLTFDDIQDDGSEMYIDRDRNKTGVRGRWWIPPEAAAVIRDVVSKTPRDPSINPKGLAFLTPQHMPLVHRAPQNKHARSDYVGSNRWAALLLAGRSYGVRHISFKYMRKGMSQCIRDEWGKELSRTFLAHAEEDIQDENYTRPLLSKVETALRAMYVEWKGMFEPIHRADWPDLMERLGGNGKAVGARTLVT